MNNNQELKKEQLAESIVRLNQAIDRVADVIGEAENSRYEVRD